MAFVHNTEEPMSCTICTSELDHSNRLSSVDGEHDCVRYIQCSTCSVVVCSHCVFKMNRDTLKLPVFINSMVQSHESRAFGIGNLPCAIRGHTLLPNTQENPYKIAVKRGIERRAFWNPIILINLVGVMTMTIPHIHALLSIYYLEFGTSVEFDIAFHRYFTGFILALDTYYVGVQTLLIILLLINKAKDFRVPIYTTTEPHDKSKPDSLEVFGHLDSVLYESPSNILNPQIAIKRHFNIVFAFCHVFFGDPFAFYRQPLSTIGILAIIMVSISYFLQASYPEVVSLWKIAIVGSIRHFIIDGATSVMRYYPYAYVLVHCTRYVDALMNNFEEFKAFRMLLWYDISIFAYIFIEKPKPPISATQALE